jgi:hypothetical protein
MVSLEQLVKEVQNEVSQKAEGRNVTWEIGPSLGLGAVGGGAKFYLSLPKP